MSATAVFGGGAWGTALGAMRAREGETVRLYARDGETVAGVNGRRENARYLPGIALPATLGATADAGEALAGASIVLLVVPAQALRLACREMRDALEPGAALVLCSKGIERDTGLFASAVVAEALPGHPVAVLSGPSFASDVASGLPTAVTLAAPDDALATDLAQRLSAPAFRIYAGTDVLGVEAGGSLKNVLAIAAGASAGLGLGASALAALVTRGFVELRRLGEALGAQPDTLLGLSGFGDLVLTCSGAQSRNFAYGQALGSGADTSGLKLAEGVFSAAIAARLARERGIEAPIIETVAAMLEEGLPAADAMRALLARPLKREFE